MADIIGFDNRRADTHRMTNTLDGNLHLHLYTDCAEGRTCVFVNGELTVTVDAGEKKSPFDCGVISLGRGDITISVSSECEISRILLVERDDIDTVEKFNVNYANKKGQFIFRREKPDYTPEMIELLRRHGFLYEELGDCTTGKMPSGIPLGGMGCGKLEICEDGMLTAFTGNNNQDSPIYRMPGSFMAFGSTEHGVKIIRRDAMSLPYASVENVESDFEFPFAKLYATDSSLPISARIEAFSPSIPHHVSDSAIPAVTFGITLKNVSACETEAIFCFSWENTINVGGSTVVTNRGERIFPTCYHTWNSSFVWSDRRVNRCEKRLIGTKPAIVFTADDDRGNSMSYGEHILCCSDENAQCLPDRSILPEDEKEFVKWLVSGRELPLLNSDTEFRAGAIAVKRKLAPGEEHRFDFTLSWYMPSFLDERGTDIGVEYSTRFSSAEQALCYTIAHKERLRKESLQVKNALSDSTLPDWFVRRLLNDRFVTVTCSWFDRNGNFAINEAPTGMGGCLGTLDQRTASQGFYTTFYPSLDQNELELFRLCQRENGMCAHEIGFAGINYDCRPFNWPDLTAAYVIQVYHSYQRIGDANIIKKHYPHIKKAIDWTLTLDDKKCCIPYISSGRGTTYDNQFWEGINSFIATMQIAAYRIGAVCARIAGDGESAELWRAYAHTAEQTRERYLYNPQKKYYNNAYNMDTGEVDDSCFICSMAGEWAALRAGLDTVIPLSRIKEVTSVITGFCVGDNGLSDQGGRRDTTRGFTQYPMAYLASAALYADNPEVAWRVASTTERVITSNRSNHFNQALTYSFDGERHGLPYYMTAPASWNMLEALVGLRADLPQKTLTLSPKINAHEETKLPVFLSGAWFSVSVASNGGSMTLNPIRSISDSTFTAIKIRGAWTCDGVKTAYDGSYTSLSLSFDPGKDSLTLYALK